MNCPTGLLSQRRAVMHEGRKPSASEEEQSSPCNVQLARVVCLQEVAVWMCVCVSCRERLLVECVSQDDSLMRASDWHFLALSNAKRNCLRWFVYMQPLVRSSESGVHVICSLIVLFRSFQKEEMENSKPWRSCT